MRTFKQRICGILSNQDGLSGAEEPNSRAEMLLKIYLFLVGNEQKPPPCVSGVCPECGGNDGEFALGQAHWFVWHKHRLKWIAASGLWPTDGKNPVVRKVHQRILQSYQEVLSA